jgi:hypothetical protein
VWDKANAREERGETGLARANGLEVWTAVLHWPRIEGSKGG